MLYLEDYLEMIEHLPQELRDRFTEMREMDLNVQNNMDSIERRSKHFFALCKRNELNESDADETFQNINKDYNKVMEEADEKVALATQMHELVERYLRRLDSELFKFKCELEADNNGITEILEKRSLGMDGSSSIMNLGTQKENRYFGSIGNNHHISGTSGISGLQLKEHRYRHRAEKRRDSGTNAGLILEKRQNLGTTGLPPQQSNSVPSTPTPNQNFMPTVPTTPNVVRSTTPSLQHAPPPPQEIQQPQAPIGAPGFNIAIATAASQAIAATQQMQQGRRSASLKASYEAFHGNSAGNGSHEMIIGREILGATHNAIQAVEREGSVLQNQRKQKKKLQVQTAAGSTTNHLATTSSSSTAAAAVAAAAVASSSSSVGLPTSAPIQTGNINIQQNNVGPNQHIEVVATRIENGLVIEQTADGEEWSYDPNEPRYCLCNQVSYGDMVACDNDTCPLEWFHYTCVGITQPPKGKWFCPKCTQSMRRRNRKN